MPYDKDGRFINAKHIFDDRSREHTETQERLEIEAMKAAILGLQRSMIEAQRENLELLKELREQRRLLLGEATRERRALPNPDRRRK